MENVFLVKRMALLKGHYLLKVEIVMKHLRTHFFGTKKSFFHEDAPMNVCHVSIRPKNSVFSCYKRTKTKNPWLQWNVSE